VATELSNLAIDENTGALSGTADLSSVTPAVYNFTVVAAARSAETDNVKTDNRVYTITVVTPTPVYAYPIDQSLRFDGGSSLTRTPTNFTGTSTTTWTWSVWVKNTSESIVTLFDTSQGSNEWVFRIDGNTLTYLHYNGSVTLNASSQGLYRDYSAWMHIVMRADTTNSQADKRINFFVNGKEVSYSSYTGIGQSIALGLNHNRLHAIGKRPSYNDRYSRCYKANIQFIDGQALDQYFFGEFKDNIWVPYNAFSTAGSGTATASDGDTATDSYGTNGFHLDFSPASIVYNGTTITQINDVSGRGNHWTAS